MSESPYFMLRAPEVRKVCEERGLSTTGVKSVLLARLLAADAKERNGVIVNKPARGRLTAVKSSSPCLPATLRPVNCSGANSPRSTGPASPEITLAVDRVSSADAHDAPVIKSIEPMLIEDSDAEASQEDKARAAEPNKSNTKSNGAEVNDKQAKIGLLRQKLLEHQQRPANTDVLAVSIPASHDTDGPPGLLDKQTPPARIPNLHMTQVPAIMTKSAGSRDSRDAQSKSNLTAPGAWSKASATKSILKVQPASASSPVATQGVSGVSSSEHGGVPIQPATTRSAAAGAEERERLKRQLLAKQQELEQKVRRLRQQQVHKETVSNTGKRPFAMVVPSKKTSTTSADTNHKRQAQAAQQQRKWLEDFDSEWKLERLTLRKRTIEETKQMMMEDLSKVRRNRAKAAQLAEECRATERQALEQLRRHIVEAKSLKFLSAPRSQAEPSIAPLASADSAEVEAK